MPKKDVKEPDETVFYVVVVKSRNAGVFRELGQDDPADELHRCYHRVKAIDENEAKTMARDQHDDPKNKVLGLAAHLCKKNSGSNKKMYLSSVEKKAKAKAKMKETGLEGKVAKKSVKKSDLANQISAMQREMGRLKKVEKELADLRNMVDPTAVMRQ
jgi:hypothetical protein